MTNKLLIVTRGGFSLWFNHKLTLTRFSLSRSPKWVSIEVNNSVSQSNIQWRGWSYAASVPSADNPNSHKGRKRVSRDERKAMVESFVKKHRAINAGKFPTASDTMKQVGGSYYVIREIIQELKYKSKMSSSNGTNENLVEKDLNESKLLTTETVKVSSGNAETAKSGPIQDNFHLAVLDGMEIVDAGHEHLEEKRRPQTISWEKSLSEEAVITTASGSHSSAAESNLLERDAEEPSQSNLWTSNDVKTEEAESSSDSVSPKCHLLVEDTEHVSAPLNENSGSSYGNAQSHESESVDMENHLIVKEKRIEKSGYERREQAALEDKEKPSQSNLQMPNDVKTEEVVSSSDFVASENHLLKEEIKNLSAPSIEISSSSQRKDHDSEFANLENHMVMDKKSIEKAEYERRELDALEDLPPIDVPKDTMEKFHGSSETNESKINNSNREISNAEVSKKTSLWGNLKSFADGIMNIWRKL